jgi:hypothetical protein
MDYSLALLINIVYALLFVLGFGVMIATVVLFTLAIWHNALRPLLYRMLESKGQRDNSP